MVFMGRLAQLAVLALFLGQLPFTFMASSGPGPMAQTDHAPIGIYLDSQFTYANGVVAGDGSLSNPYIIENWSINASSTFGIALQDTTKHVIIRNCYIYDGNDNDYPGILLWNITNVSVINNQLKDDYHGVYLYNSTAVTVRDTAISGPDRNGVNIGNSADIWIDNVTSEGSTGGFGIMVADSDHITVSNCTLSGNFYGGIEDHTTDNDTFINNTIFDHNWYGFDMVESTDARVLNNTIVNSTEGVYSIWGVRCLFQGNTLSDNVDTGMTLRDMSRSKVIDNEVHGSGEGISLETVYNSFLVGNRVHDNGEGLFLWDSTGNTFYSNVMERNGYNFGMWRWAGLDTVTTNNTIDGRPIYYWYNQSGRTVPADAAYVALVYCKDIIMKGHDLSHNQQGLIMVHSSNITVQDNDFTDNYHGIDIDTAYGNLTDNRILNTLRAMDIRNSDNNVIKRNKISNTSHGIDYWGGGDIVIEDNVIDNITNRSGYDFAALHLDDLGSTVVRNNTIHDGVGNALYSYNVHDLVAEDNDIGNFTGEGMWVRGSPSTIRNNTVLDCADGLRLEGASSQVFDNILIGNKNYGLRSDMQIDSRRSNNYIEGSNTGLLVASTAAWSVYNGNRIVGNINGVTFDGFVNGGLFYNNYFNNTLNYGGDTNYNTWNISKTLKKNIAEGPYLGGNYWSDYNGTDLDDDFLGDTKLPWGPGDMRPLLQYPAVMDRTKGVPSTNESFVLNASAYFRAGVKNVTVDYWFNNGSSGHGKASLDLASGSHYDGRYSGTVHVPADARVLLYFITANSDEGMSASTKVRNLTVIDTIGPTVKDLSGTPMTGRNFTFAIEARDNWEVTDMRVSYWFDGGNATNLSGQNVTSNVSVPEAVHYLHYTINISDAAGHWAAISVKKDVVDATAPTVFDPRGEPRTGKTMYFRCNASDNWFVAGVRLTFDFGGAASSKNMTLDAEGYFIDVAVPASATLMNFVARATDGAGNWAELNGSFPVEDKIGPVITDRPGTPTTGDYYDIVANMTDLIQGPVKNGLLDYWFDSSTPVRVNFDGFFRLLVPGFAHALNYSIWCTDPSGNPGHMNRTLAVVDNDPPAVQDSSGAGPEVKKDYRFMVEAQDNWGIKLVYVEYWFEGKRTDLVLNLTGSSYVGTIKVPAGARTLHYIVHAEDGSGNKADMSERDLAVKNPVQPPHRLTDQNGLVVTIFIAFLIAVVLMILVMVFREKAPRKKARRRPVPVEKDLSEE